MTIEKENFLRTQLVSYLKRLDPGTTPLWGKMNVQQMIEHFAGDALPIASGKIKLDLVTPPDSLERMRNFMLSEKPFKENTYNPLLTPEPPPLRFHTVEAAIGSLHEELIYFFKVFEEQPGLITRNPFFGDLNFEQNVQLLHKHAIHHLRQFGVMVLE